jgi:hypothetical protein
MEILPEVRGNLWTGDATTSAALDKPFWAILTAFDGDKYYAWTEVVPAHPNDGSFITNPGGRTGTLTTSPAIVATDDYAPINPGTATNNRFGLVMLKTAYFDNARDWVYVVVWRAGVDAVKITGTTLTDGKYFAGQLVYWNGAWVALSPSVPVWLFIDGPNLAGVKPWVPGVGEVYPSAMPMTVRGADNIPIYTAKGSKTDLNCPGIPGFVVTDLPTETAPDWVIGYKAGCLVKIAVTTC